MPIELDPIIPQTEVTPPNPLDEEAVPTYVNSFKARTGDVLPAIADYSDAMVSNTSSVLGTYVSDALNALDTALSGKQPLDTGLTSIAGLTTATDKMLYTTAHDVYAVTALTAFARTILAGADAATVRSILGLIIGTDVQAYDAGLLSLAGLTTAADKMVYTTALDTYAVTALTAFARTILEGADAATVRAILGIPINETVISVAADLPTVVSGFHVWESGLYRIDGAISSQYGHKRADGAQVYIYGKSLQGDTLTFTGGEDGAFTSVTNPGGGKSTIVTTDTGTIANGDIIFLPKTAVYDQEQRYTVSNLVSNTSFEIDVAFISTDSGTYYKGAMWTDDETASGQENALIRIENVGLIISGGGRLFDFPDGGNTRGTLWLFGCFLVGDAANYCELGTVHNFNFYTMSAIPICVSWDDGISLNDVNQVILNEQMTAWKDNNGIFVRGGTGTFNIFTMSGAGSVVSPAATEAVVYLDPGATYTTEVILDGVVNTGTFFAAGSLDNTSIYVKTSAIPGVPDSAVSAQVDAGVNAVATDNPVASAWIMVASDQWSGMDAERMTVNETTGLTTYDGLDAITLPVNFSTTIEPASGTNKALGVRILKVGVTQRVVTFTNGTNIINETTTPRVDGETIMFHDTAGTLPAELRDDIVYYVISKTANTFQVSYTSGGAAVAFTDDGSGTNSYKIATLNGIKATGNIDAGDGRSLSRFGLISLVTGDKIGIVAQNTSDALNMLVSTGGYMTLK